MVSLFTDGDFSPSNDLDWDVDDEKAFVDWRNIDKRRSDIRRLLAWRLAIVTNKDLSIKICRMLEIYLD